MVKMTHQTLPGQPIDVHEHSVAHWQRCGWAVAVDPEQLQVVPYSDAPAETNEPDGDEPVEEQ